MEFLGTLFSFKKWCFFIHGETMVLDLILCCKMHNYRKVILLNLKMFLFAWWPFFCCHKRHSIIQNYFKSLVFSQQNAVILRFEIIRDIKLSVWHKFSPPWCFCLFFQIFQIDQFCGFTLTNFFTATNAVATSWVTFSNTRIIVFFLCFDLIFLWLLDGSKLISEVE